MVSQVSAGPPHGPGKLPPRAGGTVAPASETELLARELDEAVLPTATFTEVGTFTTFHWIDQGILPPTATCV